MNAVQLNECRFIPEANTIVRSNESIRIEQRASEVLLFLIERDSELVSRNDLINAVWNGASVSDHSVAIVISDLRKAFGDDWRKPEYIETIPKRGYRLIATIDRRENIDPPLDNFVAIEAAKPSTTLRLLPPRISASIAAGAALLVAFFWPIGLGVEQQHASITPIIMAEFCTSDTPAELQDRAYGLNRMISVSLKHDQRNQVYRLQDTDRSEGLLALDGNHLMLDGALIRTDVGLVLTLELVQPESNVVHWTARYNLAQYSDEELADHVAQELSEAANHV